MTNKEKENARLLKEEIKKHMRLVEYDFFVGEDEDIVDDKELILGEEPGDEIPDEEPIDEIPVDEPVEEIPVDEPVEDIPIDDIVPEEPIGVDPMGEDEVELDITQLVQGTEQAKASSDLANEKMSGLMQQFDDLNSKLDKLEDLDAKISELEDEVVKRNPTEVEKLEMRSLDSFPYNLKLTDYWEEKEEDGEVQATDEPLNKDSEEDVEEFELTKDDIESDYNHGEIANSFNPTNDEEEDELREFKYFK